VDPRTTSPSEALLTLRRDLSRLLARSSTADDAARGTARTLGAAGARRLGGLDSPRSPFAPIVPRSPFAPIVPTDENAPPLSRGARRVKGLGTPIRKLYDVYATRHARQLMPDAGLDLLRDCGVTPAVVSEAAARSALGREPMDFDGFCGVVASLAPRSDDARGRYDSPSKGGGNDELRELFRVMSSSKAFLRAQARPRSPVVGGRLR